VLVERLWVGTALSADWMRPSRVLQYMASSPCCLESQHVWRSTSVLVATWRPTCRTRTGCS